MADDVEAEAERAANAARSAVKRANRASFSFLPLLIVAFAALTAILLLWMDERAPPTRPADSGTTTTLPNN